MLSEKTLLNNSQSTDNKTNLLIIRLFKTISDNENQIEAIRQVLNDHLDFNPDLFFKIIDQQNKGKFSIEELKSFLNSNSIFCDSETVKMLISFYDMSMDGCLNFDEFKNFIISHKNPGFKKITKIDYNVESKIPSDMFHTVIKLFVNEIQFANKIIELLKMLTNSMNYNAWNLFTSITKGNKEIITEEMLSEFLSSLGETINTSTGRGFKFNKLNINSIFRRIDILRDEAIEFKEFKVFFNYRNYSKISSLENYEFLSKEVINEKMSKTFSSRFSTQNSILLNKTMNIDEKSINKNVLSSTLRNTGFKFNTFHISSNKKFSSLEEEMLINYFAFVIKSENEIESIKISLAKQNEFNLIDIYHLFLNLSNANNYSHENEFNYSRNYDTDTILREGFKKGMNLFNSYPTDTELKLLSLRYFKKEKNLINFNNFCNLFLPTHPAYRRLMRNRKSCFSSFYNNNDFVSSEIKDLVKTLFTKVISNETSIESWRVKLSNIKTFNIRNLFERISNLKEGGITFEGFDEYLAKFEISKEESECLFIRLDKEDRKRITYSNVRNMLLIGFSFLMSCSHKLFNLDL